ncbi:MAG: hypothetical protein M3R01_15260 [Actinomycetota bacterium]|nr:hypothetical protein [Actinomycetota bacterium]
MARDEQRQRRRRLATAGLTATMVAGSLALGSGSASAAGRVDLAEPTFSDPTSITNPLFPISELTQVLQLGEEAGEALRHEITLLEDTKTIEWNGQRVETLVSQFVAYGDGRILEAATDYFAQADDGSVWYFGEDVDNYEDGVIANHEGTWLAGRDGPPGMIMPADPQVGDVFRPENIPGLVFEEVTVKSVGDTVPGPRGPVPGALLVQERLLDGTLEDKVYAPGYGEFQARVRTEDELVTVALGVPTDALEGDVPDPLSALSSRAARIFKAAPRGDWDRVSALHDRLATTWEEYRGGEVPDLLGAEVDDAVDTLAAAVEARDAGEVAQAALDLSELALDLQLQYRDPSEVDEDRLGVWRRQLRLDRATGDAAGVAGDRATVELIKDRIADDDERDDDDGDDDDERDDDD